MDEREKFGNEGGSAGGRLKELTSIQNHFSSHIFARWHASFTQ